MWLGTMSIISPKPAWRKLSANCPNCSSVPKARIDLGRIDDVVAMRASRARPKEGREIECADPQARKIVDQPPDFIECQMAAQLNAISGRRNFNCRRLHKKCFLTNAAQWTGSQRGGKMPPRDGRYPSGVTLNLPECTL